jgi:hypothetical protein
MLVFIIKLISAWGSTKKGNVVAYNQFESDHY